MDSTYVRGQPNGLPVNNPGRAEIPSYNPEGMRTLAVNVDVFPASTVGTMEVQVFDPKGATVWTFRFPDQGTQANLTLRPTMLGAYTLSWIALGPFAWQVRTFTFSCDPIEGEPEIFQVDSFDFTTQKPVRQDCLTEPVNERLLDWRYSSEGGDKSGTEHFEVPIGAYHANVFPAIVEVLDGNWSARVEMPSNETWFSFEGPSIYVHGLDLESHASEIITRKGLSSGMYSYDWRVSGKAKSLLLQIYVSHCE